MPHPANQQFCQAFQQAEKKARKICETEKLHIYLQPKGFTIYKSQNETSNFQALATPTRSNQLDKV